MSEITIVSSIKKAVQTETPKTPTGDPLQPTREF